MEPIKIGANMARSLEFEKTPKLEDNKEIENEEDTDFSLEKRLNSRGQPSPVARRLSHSQYEYEGLSFLVAVENSHEDIIRLFLQNTLSAVEMKYGNGRTVLDETLYLELLLLSFHFGRHTIPSIYEITSILK